MSRSKTTALFADPWRRYRFDGWLRLALRWYGRTLSFALPRAATLAAVAGGLSLWGVRTVESLGWAHFLTDAERVSLGVSWSLLLLLWATPLTTGWAFRRVAEAWAGQRLSFPPVRWYRLAGVGVYLAVPFGVLAAAFPLGMLLLPVYVWWMFAPLAVLVEGEGGRTALRRSRYLGMGEFSQIALPTVLSLTLFFIGMTMAQRIVPHPPKGFLVTPEGKYVRPLNEAERFDPETQLITGADGRLIPVPEEALYDADSRALILPAPEPLSWRAALAWAGVPAVLAALADPVRWYLVALLYLGLRRRREGWSRSEMLQELGLPRKPESPANEDATPWPEQPPSSTKTSS